MNAAAFLLSTESSKTIFIAVKDDDLPEADETFTFNLTLQVQYLTINQYLKIPYDSRSKCYVIFFSFLILITSLFGPKSVTTLIRPSGGSFELSLL